MFFLKKLLPHFSLWLLAFTLFLLLVSPSVFADSHSWAEPIPEGNQIIRLATTTSTQNSGLLQHLLPLFEKQTGYQIHVIAVGTGKALQMGRNGDVDLLMVHAPAAEKQFIREGYGLKRIGLMYNDFVLVGPQNDPAEVSKAHNIAEAMSRIVEKKPLFISRGDDSGTHKKELSLWQPFIKKGLPLKNSPWYREAGQGMGKVLQIADELNAYTLTDRGTWLSYQNELHLKIVFSGDPLLFNPYSVILINPKRFPDLNHQGASALSRWLISPQGQKLIGNYRVKNTRLFTPSADESELQYP